MKNPYEVELAEDRVLPGKTALIVFVLVFVFFLFVPTAFRAIEREGFSAISGETLKSRLVAVEESVESQELFERWRRNDQELFLEAFGKGNRRVVVGRDGWLYYRPDLEAVYGKGPRYIEPSSVAREVVDDSWQPPIPLIKGFSDHLASLDIELLVVPVPTKAMLSPQGVTEQEPPIVSPEYSEVLEELRGQGVKVLDLIPLFLSLSPGERFLKADTHWTATAMEKVASQVANSLRSVKPKTNDGFRFSEISRSHAGDLVGMLDVDESTFSVESQTLRRVESPFEEERGGEGHVLLGDSFVNVYDDPSLGFEAEGETSIGAGFAAHYSAALGVPVETYAINGGGSTAVRRALAALHPHDLVMKKSVVWVFSSRDLLLAELPARRAGIEWRPVEFNQEQSPETESSSFIVVAATLSARSPVGDPKQTPYESAVYSAIFTDIEGEYEKEELFAFLWSFEKRVLKPTANLRSGGRYRLHLVPFEDAVEAGRATQIDDFFRTDLDRWFVEKAEPLP